MMILEDKKYYKMSLEELIRERKNIISNIENYESKRLVKDDEMQFLDDDTLKPSARTFYVENNWDLIEVSRLINRKINMRRNKAKAYREGIVDLHKLREERANCQDMKNFVSEKIKLIKNQLEMSYFDFKDKIILSARQEACKNEFVAYLEENNMEAAFWDICEFIDSDKEGNYSNLMEQESGYKYTSLISYEEMEIIQEMIEEFSHKFLN